MYTVLAQDVTPSSPEASSELGGLFEVDGRQLYLVCFGAGSPTVVIDAGQGGFELAIGQLRKELARDNMACVYNGAGQGTSDPAPSLPPQRR